LEAGWLVLDFFDVIVHLMRADARHRYDLEGLWGDAPRVRGKHPAGTRTGKSISSRAKGGPAEPPRS
jgi:hypothetical protein